MHALILVDLQNDFCPGGALAVPHGDEVIAVANRLMPRFPLVVATQDWHPADHGSFARSHAGGKPFDLGELAGLPQVLWPAHCVQGTPGAELHAGLDRTRIAAVLPKGTDRTVDSYSGFVDNGRRKTTGLADWLRRHHVDAVTVMGLATDYCMKATTLDAVALGLATRVVLDGCRGVELKPGDCAIALDSLFAARIDVVMADEVVDVR